MSNVEEDERKRIEKIKKLLIASLAVATVSVGLHFIYFCTALALKVVVREFICLFIANLASTALCAMMFHRMKINNRWTSNCQVSQILSDFVYRISDHFYPTVDARFSRISPI